MSDTFKRLLEASNPLRPFTVELGGEKITLYGKKAVTRVLEDSNIAWDKAYRAAKENFIESDVDSTAAYDTMKRTKAERLAKLIADADRRELREEAMLLLDASDPEDELVVEQTDELVKNRIAELMNVDHESLVQMALERRAHYSALAVANAAQSRVIAAATIFADELDAENKPTGNRVLLFDAPEKLTELPLDALSVIMDEYTKLFTREAVDDPLPSPATP